jgi:hypothetical protein
MGFFLFPPLKTKLNPRLTDYKKKLYAGCKYENESLSFDFLTHNAVNPTSLFTKICSIVKKMGKAVAEFKFNAIHTINAEARTKVEAFHIRPWLLHFRIYFINLKFALKFSDVKNSHN